MSHLHLNTLYTLIEKEHGVSVAAARRLWYVLIYLAPLCQYIVKKAKSLYISVSN